MLQSMKWPVLLATGVLAAHHALASPLEDFVHTPDAAYEYTVQSSTEHTHLGVVYTQYDIRMYSQRWRTEAEVNHTRWVHKIILAVPHEPLTDMGYLLIEGGFTNMWLPPVDLREQVVRMRAPLAMVLYVPNQPLIFAGETTGRSEDDIIAYSFDQYLRTGDENWPVLFPMVKAAVRAMDTVTEIAAAEHGVTINRFCVSGASKRGWTAWLTAAVDPRVQAVVPIVIDVLNMEAQINRHFDAYGYYTSSLGPYVREGIFERFWLPRAQALTQMVDPFAYRERLAMPKYIVSSPGDSYFLPDSSQYYAHELPGETKLRYVPNTGHGIGTDRSVILYNTNFFIAVSRGLTRPRIDWEWLEDGALRVRAYDGFVNGVRLWQADNPNARSFFYSGGTGISFTATDLSEESPGSNTYRVRVEPPDTGYRAFFVEVRFPASLMLTTDVFILPDVLPFRPNVRIVRASPGGEFPLDSDVLFEVEIADNLEPVMYQWYKDGDPLQGESGPFLLLEGVTPDDEGHYACRIREGVKRALYTHAIPLFIGEGGELPIPGDINRDGVVNAVDVQLVINAALGLPLEPGHDADINGDGKINAVDVQLVINATLGLSTLVPISR